MHILVRTPKCPPHLIFEGACHGQKTGTVTKTIYQLRHVTTTCDKHVSMSAGHVSLIWTGSFFDFFTFSFHRFRYFVFSVLDFGKFKCSHNSIYWNLWQSLLFIIYVNKHNFESPWLWKQLYFDYICLLQFIVVPVATDSCHYPVKYCLAWVEK